MTPKNKKIKFEKTKCPICDGKGHYMRKVQWSNKEKIMAVQMFKKGLSLRKIAEKFGVKGKPQIVKGMIKTAVY